MHWFLFSFFKLRISPNFKNQEKKTLICYFNAYLSIGLPQNDKTEFNYVYVFIKYLCIVVPYYTIKTNILFLLLNLDKSLE